MSDKQKCRKEDRPGDGELAGEEFEHAGKAE
jgi:hypothetical protein